MKKFNIIIVFIMVATLCIFPSCGGDGDDTDILPTAEELMTEKLSKTWNVSSSNTVTVNSEDVTADFAGFSITMSSNGSYTTNSGTLIRTPTPWPTSGNLDFGGTADAPNLNQLVRNDGLTISIVATETTLQMTFTFADQHTDSTGGRTEVIDGNWVFEFAAN